MILQLYKYSRQQIHDLYEHFWVDYTKNKKFKKDFKKQIDTVESKLLNSGMNSSNMEMVLDLIKSKKLTPEILWPLYKSGNISRNVSEDLDKLYKAYSEGKNVKDIFVPKFKDTKEAVRNIKTGDVCQIEGQNTISIKMPDGTIKKLFITPETYLELFPPVERFIVKQSDFVGDCYLLASLNSINQNPDARNKILEMFRENQDGTVDVTFEGFELKNGQIIQKNPENVLLHDISTQIHNISRANVVSHTCEGIRAIELLHEKERSASKSALIDAVYKEFQELKSYIKNNERVIPAIYDSFFKIVYSKDEIEQMQRKYEKNNSILSRSEKVYTEEEMDYFCSYVDEGKEEELFCKDFYDNRKHSI